MIQRLCPRSPFPMSNDQLPSHYAVAYQAVALTERVVRIACRSFLALSLLTCGGLLLTGAMAGFVAAAIAPAEVDRLAHLLYGALTANIFTTFFFLMTAGFLLPVTLLMAAFLSGACLLRLWSSTSEELQAYATCFLS